MKNKLEKDTNYATSMRKYFRDYAFLSLYSVLGIKEAKEKHDKLKINNLKVGEE